MYSTKSNLCIGFHGCEESRQKKLIADASYYKMSEEAFDWLGHGMYFWDNNEKRALQWALDKKKAKKLENPAVVGAVLDLGRCFDLLDNSHIDTLKKYYELFKADIMNSGLQMPENRDHPNSKGDRILRELDCAVIEYMHNTIDKNNLISFDSVRAVFVEGKPIYPNAGFYDKSHIQICIRNPNCIKGVFLPRKNNSKYNLV